jgi:putative PIN family toxin of toxin-antitoxin system
VIRVTLDSNEWISAFNFRGKALEIIHKALSGDIQIAISQPIIDETLRVLRRDFDWQPYRLHDLGQQLLKICRLVAPTEKLAVVADEPDNRIVECAVKAGSEYIVTEDHHLLKVGQYGAIKIVRSREFLS